MVAEPEEKVVHEAVTKSQVFRVACASSVGMLGFGFVDNFVMIIAGDAIDASLGSTLGLSAMAAAALGNTLSDVIGYYTGDAMEALCEKFGIGTPPPLSDEQLANPAVKSAQRHGGCIGLTVGCLLGMCPLLWTGERRVNISPAELMVYNDIFGPEQVSPEDFRTLLDAGKWKTAVDGEVIVQAGEAYPNVMILVDGLFDPLQPDGSPDTGFVAKTTWRNCADTQPELLKGRMSKNVIGGTKIVDELAYVHGEHASRKEWDAYPRTIKAKGSAQYIIWNKTVLANLCLSNHALERAFCALVRKDAREKKSRMKKQLESEVVLAKMDVMIESVVCDNIVAQSEKIMVTDFCARHGVPAADLHKALEKQGWTWDEWQRGRKSRARK